MTTARAPRATKAAAAVVGSSATALLAASEDFLAAAGRDAPEGMLAVVADAHAFPQVIDNLAKALKIRYDKAENLPMHPAIKALYAAMHGAMVAVQKHAEDVGPLIERIHHDKLDRLRNPQVNEDMWDLRANQGA